MSRIEYARKNNKQGLCRNCPEPLANGSKIFCKYHREKDRIHGRASSKKFAIKLKNEILEHYGNACSCCGESITQFLTIDHTGGNGNNHRKELFKHNVGGVHMYRWLKKNKFPGGYTILCMNCNWARRYNNVCPHTQTKKAKMEG